MGTCQLLHAILHHQKGYFRVKDTPFTTSTSQIQNSNSATATKAKQLMHVTILGATLKLHILRRFETRAVSRITGPKGGKN
jgi:hypothetical protein